MPYIPPTPRTREQRDLVNAGYIWFSTVVLVPEGQPGNSVLNNHAHQSHNTHFILQGQLTIKPSGSSKAYLDANSHNWNHREKKVPPYTAYRGSAGPNGATFIEAHTILSPTTADRFEARGHLRWEHGRETKDEWFANHRQQRERELGRVPGRRLGHIN